ncbi:glycoside hydrolase family 99-like domain-containing protein [Rhodoferax sp.]|uniref:glycoside hydrolase family 99-like domain-containing protein n=1 Tax=Rhodoferax sp. TaxID=50421 RepID=UPI00260BBC8D|nr:glycoside hydrolase family 99-like domain-containing protein [Rhodoferax sp.]MDD2923809.1 glycoside hydrolase family 99-like domain-containing protein [Rhodoferax sp.]
MNNKRLIVVLGMHRSGTSAITRGLQVLGVDLGQTMYGPLAGVNEKGFWEDIYFNDLDVEILNDLGLDWHSLANIDEKDVDVLRNKGFFLRAVELLRQKVDDSPLFGFKDPRVTKLLPFWRAVFKHCEFDVGYVLALRHPISVVKSLKKRDNFDAEKSYLLWLGHVIRMMSDSADGKRVLVDYDSLMLLPDHQLGRIAEQLNLIIDHDALQVYKQEFLDLGLRHTVYDLNDLALDDACPALVREVYAALVKVASDNVPINSPELRDMVARWAAEFERMSSFLNLADRLYTQKDAALKAIVKCDSQITSMGQTLADKEGQIASLNKAIGERDSQITSMGQTLADKEGQIASLNKAIGERDSQIVSMGQGLPSEQSQIAGLSQDLAAKEVQIASLNQTLAERSEWLNSLEITVDNIKKSKSWRITQPLRSCLDFIHQAKRLLSLFLQIIRVGGGFFSTTRTVLNVVLSEGISGIRWRINNVKQISETQSQQINEEYRQIAFNKSPFSIVPYYIDPLLDIRPPESLNKTSVALHLHLFYTDMLLQMVDYLNNLPIQYDLYVSVQKSTIINNIENELKKLLKNAKLIVVERVENRGRNIAPLIAQFGGRLAEYEIICHIHTKKSPHNSNLTGWHEEIMTNLLGKPNSTGGHVTHIIKLLQSNAKIVYSAGKNNFIKAPTGWDDNYQIAKNILITHTKISIQNFSTVEFPEGAMFWGRADCLKEFLSLPLGYDDFEKEPIPADGTLAHALERLILIFASQYPGNCIRIHNMDSIEDYQQYEIQHDYSDNIIHSNIKVLAYYLPQFHPIPENDRWHGEGFTEWTKVKAAYPLFQGHYQQHIPHADLGYYLLNSADVLKSQAAMMKKSGVYGQIFYHYWFSGKLILEKPAQLLLDNKDICIPFCFCWANENWTRRWDGNESDILLGQNYSAQDAREFINYLIPFFRDSRYIRVEDRPVLFIYRPSSIPNCKEYLDIWREECFNAGIKQPYVVAVLTRGASDPRNFGMDAGTERNLHDWTGGAVPDIKSSLNQYWPVNGSVLAYDAVANFYAGQTDTKDFCYFRATVPNWDNTARYGSEAFLLHGSTPQRFQEWMENSIAYTQANLPVDRQFLIVNAWNEWAEGAHLEPDSRYGYAYLNSVGRALSGKAYSATEYGGQNYPTGIKLHISIPEFVIRQLDLDELLRKRFFRCILNSTIFESCSVSVKSADLGKYISMAVIQEPDESDFILEFRRVAFFNSDAIEQMLALAFVSGSTVISNCYNINSSPFMVTENGSVASSNGYDAPMLIFPARVEKSGHKNFKISTNARSFLALPSNKNNVTQNRVTTIIRFHKSADLDELENALFTLYAMRDCIVTPLIAAQDLEEQQVLALENLIANFDWPNDCKAQVFSYYSENGKSDLRSTMLNESLLRVKTRYAAFLDFDDLLSPDAYIWLIDRLKVTGKSVSFGRVYSTIYNSESQLIINRKRNYEYGYSYDEFLTHNHAPLHSFMLDLDNLNLTHILYLPGQRFMEDYLLTLQLFSKNNCDWDSLKENKYIGDYIHSMNRDHTLAFEDEKDRQKILSSPEYMKCEKLICDMRNAISSSQFSQNSSAFVKSFKIMWPEICDLSLVKKNINHIKL